MMSVEYLLQVQCYIIARLQHHKWVEYYTSSADLKSELSYFTAVRIIGKLGYIDRRPPSEVGVRDVLPEPVG